MTFTYLSLNLGEDSEDSVQLLGKKKHTLYDFQWLKDIFYEDIDEFDKTQGTKLCKIRIFAISLLIMMNMTVFWLITEAYYQMIAINMNIGIIS